MIKEIKSIPTGIKVMSIIYYIGAIIAIFMGIFGLVVGTLLGFILKISSGNNPFGRPVFYLLAGSILIFGIITFFVARGLQNLKLWARIIAILLSTCGVILAITGMVQGFVVQNIPFLIIHLLLSGYLLFSKKVKVAFSKN